MANSLPAQVTQAVGAPATLRVGTISSTTPLVLTIQGASFSGAAVGILGSYVPQLGETVAVVGQSKTQGSDPASWLILGSSNPLTATGPVPQVKAWHSAAQSVPDATATAIQFQTNLWDTGGMHDTITNNTRFYATRAGRYLVMGGLGWSINSTGRRGVALRVNSLVAQTFSEVSYQAVNGSFTFEQLTGEVDLNVGDYVDMWANQFSGVAINTFAGGMQYSWLSMRWLNASVG